jgi:hypothetical protein
MWAATAEHISDVCVHGGTAAPTSAASTGRVSPAMAAGITDTLMSMVAAMVEAATAKQGKRGPYKKRPAAALVQ